MAVVLEFFRIVREEWLKGGQSIDLFNECKIISKLSYDIYAVTDSERFV